MNIISVPGQSGRSYNVRIAGDAPTPEEQAKIDSFVAQRDAEFASMQERYLGPRAAQGAEEDTGPDTSFGSAFRYTIDQPLENIAASARALGSEGIGAFFSNLTEAPKNYQPASEGFMNEDGSFYDFSYAPRAAVEQAGQIAGSFASRAAGAVLGGAAGSLAGPGGAATGAIAGAIAAPALLNAAQVLGPVAYERAMNNGRTEPNSEDIQYAVATAAASGALDAIAPNLGGYLIKVLTEAGTEGIQSLIEQAGSTAETDVGLQISPRQAVGEAILGGGVAGTILAPGAVMERRAKRAEEEKKALDELEEDQIEMASDVENRIKFGLEAIDNEQEFEAEPRRPIPTALLPNITLNPQEEKVAQEAQARGQMDDLAKGNTVPTTQRTFELDQYDEAVRRIRELGRFSAPAIQSAVRKKTGAQVPMSVVRDIRDEMVRRGVLRADVASKEGYVLEPEKVEKFSEAESLQKTMDQIERAIEADRKERERAAQEARRLEQTGAKPSAVRAEALKVDAADARIAQAEATRAEVIQRIANVERSQRVPTQERPGSPIADGQMATAIADVSPEAQQVVLQRQQQNLKASLDAYNERIKQQKAILSKLKAGAKKVQLPKSELAKMETIQRGIEADTRAVEAIKKRMSNPSSDLQIAKEQAVANQARVNAEQAAKAAPPVYSGKEQAIFNALRQRLSNLGLSDVRLTAERMINPEAAKQGQLIEGMFDTKDGNRIISLALSTFDPSLNAKQLEQALAGVMNHEVIHALRNLGLFTDAEWRSLTELARRQKYMKVKGGKSVERAYTYFQRAQRMYPEGDAELHVEEAVAEMFRDYVDGKLKVGGKPKTLLDRIKNFFKAIRGAHVDAEIDPNTIFQGIQMGEIGRRERRTEKPGAEGDARLSRSAARDAFLAGNHPDVPDVLYHGSAPRVVESQRYLGDGKFETKIDQEATDRNIAAQDFSEFMPSQYGNYGPGIYLSDSPQVASSYAQGIRADQLEAKPNGQVMKLNVSMKQPFTDNVLRNPAWKEYIKSALTRYSIPDGEERSARDAILRALDDNTATVRDLFLRDTPRGTMVNQQGQHDIHDTIRNSGFDGIIAGRPDGSKEYVVFKPEQVKSALSASKFDPTSPDMRLSVAVTNRAKQAAKFSDWFDGSVAVDANGDPQIYYTGTSKDKDFTSFNVGRHGGWFTTDPTEASNYAEQNDSMGYRADGWSYTKTNTASRVIPAFLSIKNPYRGPKPRWVMEKDNYKKAQSDWFDVLRSQGYDAWMPQGDGSGFVPNIAVVLKEPQQIKSVFAKEFNPSSKDMRLSVLKTNGLYDRGRMDAVENYHRERAITQMDENGNTPDRISTRQPYTKRATENPITQDLRINLDAMKASDKAFTYNMNVLKGYPGFVTTSEDPDQIAEDFMSFVEGNLIWLHNNVPKEIREQSKLWYDGARRITENWSGQYDVPDYVVAGVLASLSPQKDWYQNVSLAERVLDIHTNFTTGDNVGFVPNDEMAATAKRIYGKDKYAADLIVVLNTPYSQINDEQQQAMWLRIYDETYNPRGYRTVSADGQFVGDAKGKVAWGSNVEIGKAIYALKNQNRASVSAAMGEMHKVRNFFNNILAPKADAGDVTIDTHAVAAALLRPLSGSSTEVHHNFGSTPEKNKQKEDWVPIKNIGDSGSMGTYGIYADAYRRAAEKLGILPRELQSITWEAVRGLFPAVDKRNKGRVAQVNDEWKKVSAGSLSVAEARENIRNIMGGINDPTWYGLDYSEAGATAPSSYEGELAVSRLNRGYERSISGTSGRDAARTGGTAGRSGAASADVSGRTPGAAARGGPAGGSSRAAGPRQSAADTQPGRAGDRGRGQAVRSLAPLEGAPNVRGAAGPDPQLIEVAEEYARSIGIDLKRQSEFVEVDEDRARRIAAAYDEMKDDPQNPQVKEAYENLIKQTLAQYRALEKAGYKFWFIDTDNDNGYSESPWNAMRDLRANKRMGVFPTTSGYGTGDFDLDPEKNPLLADTGIKWPWGSPDGPPKTVLANDLFRAVHDAFGHGLEGAGFRARGEENAWQAHIRLFTGSAQGAITSETRGQNSWLNYGPYGEQNRNAKVEDTIFAEQKIGLMPEWTWTEGRAGDMEFPDTGRYSRLSAVPALSRANYQQIGNAQKQVMYARSADVLAKVLNLKGYGFEINKAKRIADGILRRFQDKMLPVGRMIQDLANAGLNITDAMDTYLQEELMYGVVGERIDQNQKRLYEPTAQAIKSLNVSDAEIERLKKISNAAAPDGKGFVSYALDRSPSKRIVLADAYLYAKHAKERNKFIKDVREPTNESGSGMTDAEADAILNWFNSLQGTNRQAIANIERNIRAIVADTNRTRLDGGLISQEAIDDGTGWQFYVPLRGIYDPDGDRSEDTDENFKSARGGIGFGARGKEDPNALGRYGAASDIVANVFAQNQSAIVRAERNKVGQSFLRLLRADPTKTGAYAEVLDKVPMRRVKDSTGKVMLVPDQKAAEDPMVMIVKENGKQTYVRFTDARLAGAMNGRNGYSPGTGRALLNAMSKINRYLASINTSYNPEFMITNAFRDLQTAGVNVNQYELDGMTKDVMKNVVAAGRGIGRSIFKGDETSEWAKIYKDFVAAGGQNATNQINSLADQIENIEALLGDIAEDGMRGKWAKMKNSFVGKGAASILQMLEDANTVVENGVRVATYKALLDRGFTRQRAAQAARNVTVNFAKGGDFSPLMNAWYLFYNASIQGTFAMLNAAVRSPKVRKLWVGVMAAGAAQEFMNAMMSGEDDDGQLLYDKIPDYIKERNLILMDFLGISERGYLAIPMPYGLNMAHAAGRNAAAAIRGSISPEEATMKILAVAADVLNPIGGTESFLNMVAPTVADPFIDIYENEDYSDKPIYKEGLPFDRTPAPSSQMYWNSTSPSAIWIADNLNSLTGGNAARSGLIDFSPDVIQYWFEFLTGGVGRFALNGAESATIIATEGMSDDLVRNIPIFRRAFGSVSEREDVGLYMERASRVLMAGEELKQAREAGDGEWARETIQKYQNELRMLGQVKAFETALRKISRQMNEVEKNSRISPEQKARIMDALDKRKQNILMNANRILYRLE